MKGPETNKQFINKMASLWTQTICLFLMAFFHDNVLRRYKTLSENLTRAIMKTESLFLNDASWDCPSLTRIFSFGSSHTDVCAVYIIPPPPGLAAERGGFSG